MGVEGLDVAIVRSPSASMGIGAVMATLGGASANVHGLIIACRTPASGRRRISLTRRSRPRGLHGSPVGGRPRPYGLATLASACRHPRLGITYAVRRIIGPVVQITPRPSTTSSRGGLIGVVGCISAGLRNAANAVRITRTSSRGCLAAGIPTWSFA